MGLEELIARVHGEYARAGMPSWPPPRPDGAEAREEEYSRVSDVHKYRVVHARARAWTTALADLPGVRVEHRGPVDGVAQAYSDLPGSFDRATHLTCDRSGTLPLVLLERDAVSYEHGDSVDLLQITVGEPPFPVDMQPDCGCDACDVGSAGLLEAIDDRVVEIVGGPFVTVRGRRWSATWHPDGGGMSGSPRAPHGFTSVMAACRRLAAGEAARLPEGCAVQVGHAWIDR
ncbi:DUF6226 family protein [Isoptericola sp. BMS4]|uniref:DUF6226 family protein n=1 Tax=Isoptericola sp. BMS4 TaxID=2527875 RepID=UPI0014247052|nr:DUF6226 family protein [Isoptericola sp. BMS4]